MTTINKKRKKNKKQKKKSRLFPDLDQCPATENPTQGTN